LVRPGDAEDLADKIAQALDARAQWPAWGDASVQIVRTTFDWPVVARRTLTEYERMIGERVISNY
jgi:glycosyltransferase involved in cell wall biosynthesis